MKYVKSLSLVFAFVLSSAVMASAVSAQQAPQTPQSSQSLQQQSSAAQNTGQVQSGSGSQVQTNQTGDFLNQNRPSSLGVVGDPDQTNPSVTASQTDGSTQSDIRKSQPNLLLLFVLVAAVVLAGLFIMNTPDGPLPEEVAHEPIAEEEIKPVKKPKKKPAAVAGRKKKKKAHR